MRVVKFEQDNCNPCKLVSTFLDAANIKYERVNAFEDPDYASTMGVMSVPTTIIFDGDKEVFRTQGYKIEELKQLSRILTGE